MHFSPELIQEGPALCQAVPASYVHPQKLFRLNFTFIVMKNLSQKYEVTEQPEDPQGVALYLRLCGPPSFFPFPYLSPGKGRNGWPGWWVVNDVSSLFLPLCLSDNVWMAATRAGAFTLTSPHQWSGILEVGPYLLCDYVARRTTPVCRFPLNCSPRTTPGSNISLKIKSLDLRTAR